MENINILYNAGNNVDDDSGYGGNIIKYVDAINPDGSIHVIIHAPK